MENFRRDYFCEFKNTDERGDGKKMRDTVLKLLRRIKEEKRIEKKKTRGKADEAEMRKMRFELSRMKRKLKEKDKNEKKNNVIIKRLKDTDVNGRKGKKMSKKGI